MVADPRSTAQRIADTRRRLERDLDLWVASSGADGPWLVPLSFLTETRDDGVVELLIATDASTRTGRNLAGDERIRLGLGDLRDLAMIDGTAQIGPIEQLSPQQVERYLAKHHSDPRTWADSVIRVTVTRIQAWREENELRGRTILRAGRWLEE